MSRVNSLGRLTGTAAGSGANQLTAGLLAGLVQRPQTGRTSSTPMSTATAQRLTAILHREEEVYVAECPEVGTVSQGDTVEEALANLRVATELFLEECPQPVPVPRLLTTFEVSVA